MATPKGLHILLFVMLCLRLCYSHGLLLVSSNEKAKDLHSHAEVGGVGSGSGMVGGGGSGDRSVPLLYDWPCGSESGCPLCPNHGVCGSCDCASCGPPCYNPFDPSCSGWVWVCQPLLPPLNLSLPLQPLACPSKLINTSVNRCNSIQLCESLTVIGSWNRLSQFHLPYLPSSCFLLAK